MEPLWSHCAEVVHRAGQADRRDGRPPLVCKMSFDMMRLNEAHLFEGVEAVISATDLTRHPGERRDLPADARTAVVSPIPGARSCHVGLIEATRSSFHERRQVFHCFSRSIAAVMLSPASK